MKTLRMFFSAAVLVLTIVEFAFPQSGWISTQLGTRNYVAVNFIDKNRGFIFGNDGLVFKTTDGGKVWNLANNFGAFLQNGLAVNENVICVISNYMIHSTTNGGQNWRSCQEDFIPIGGSASFYLRSLTFINHTTGFVCGSEFGGTYLVGIIYKTTNSGVNWFLSARRGFDYYDIKFQDENTGYVALGGVDKTTDSGNSWKYVGAVFSQTFSISPINDTIFMSSTNGNVFRSINGGIDWTTYNTTSNDSLLRVFFVNSLTGFAVGTMGTIVKTTDGGLNWSLQTSNTNRKLRSMYMINKDTGIIVGDYGTILKTTTGGVLTGFSNTSSEIPDKYFLSQNYPNPFNPSSNLGFGISDWGFVTLKVYDILGNEVETLVNEIKLAGNYQVEFDEKIYQAEYIFTV